MKYSQIKVRLTGTADILGSSPTDKEVYTNYIATKAAGTDQENVAKDDVKSIADTIEEAGKVTAFYRDIDGLPILKGYQIKGFLKAAANALKSQVKLASAASKFDKFVFVMERDLPLYRQDGTRIETPDGYLERPLRAETMQGPRVSLSKSEKINEGWCCECTIRVLDNEGTAKSSKVTVDMIKEILDYGSLNGLLQWRNAGYGAFTFEILEETSN